MRGFSFIAWTMFLSLALYVPAQAAAINKGAIELSTDANVTFSHSEVPNSSTNTTSGTMRVGCGYFILDGLQVGGSVMDTLSESKTTGSDSTDSNTFDLDLFVKYHIYPKVWASNHVLKAIVPYVGVQGGWINVYSKTKGASTSGDSISYGGMGGIKYFISEDVSLNGEYNYRHYDVTIGKNNPKTTSDDSKILFGFSVYFGR